MLYLRKSQERGLVDFNWLKSYHSFSFGDYYDPQHMGFGPLIVINEDWLLPKQGIPMHPHKNMEIFTYIIEGSIEHKDSLGNTQISHAGEVQKMSAGRGVIHSEFNASTTEILHIYQIWIQPNKMGITPSYHQASLTSKIANNELNLLLAADSSENAPLHIEQDASVYFGKLQNKTLILPNIKKDRKYWIQVIDGSLTVNNTQLHAGDGLGLTQLDSLTLEIPKSAHILYFDLSL